jgi:hypothetical protein
MFVYLLFTKQGIISISIYNTSQLFIKKILPTLFPLFIISKILINYNLPYYIAKIFHNNLYIYVFIISLLSGCPNNAIIIKDLLNSNAISIKQANKYITCTFFSNPLFLFTMLNNMFSLKISLIIILSHYLSNIIIYLYNPVKNNNVTKISTKPLNKALIYSIKDAGSLFINIYLTIILFNIIIAIIPNKLMPISGLIELSQGLNYLKYANISNNFKILLTLIFISFGGLSIQMQVINALSDTKIESRLFIKSRFYQIMISLILFLITSIILI